MSCFWKRAIPGLFLKVFPWLDSNCSCLILEFGSDRLANRHTTIAQGSLVSHKTPQLIVSHNNAAAYCRQIVVSSSRWNSLVFYLVSNIVYGKSLYTNNIESFSCAEDVCPNLVSNCWPSALYPCVIPLLSLSTKKGCPWPLFHLFSVFFKQTLHFYNKISWINVHPEHGTGIRTHNH